MEEAQAGYNERLIYFDLTYKHWLERIRSNVFPKEYMAYYEVSMLSERRS